MLKPTDGEGTTRSAALSALREDAMAAWAAGLRAVAPEAAVVGALRPGRDTAGGASSLRCEGPTMVVAVGKAAAGMLRGAAACIDLPPGRAFLLLPDGAVAGPLPDGVVLLRGGHPFPTSESAESTRRILGEAASLGDGQHLLVLLSGGASALLEAPADGLSFDDVVAAHRALVGSGLPIAAINLVRGCLSAVKAGGLALAAAPASVTTLAISDVRGDDPAAIGSGPTVMPIESKASRCRRALALLDSGAVRLPGPVRAHLERNASLGIRDGGAGEAGDGTSAKGQGDYIVVASISLAVAAARAELASRGYELAVDAGYLSGSTDTAAAEILAAATSKPGGGSRAAVLGGETTVTLAPGASGRGGRNLDLASRLALALAGRDDAAVVAAGTDGIDGSSRAAGACVDGRSAARAAAAGLPLEAALAAFDTEPALAAAGDLLEPGPTGTNVGDLVVLALR